MARNPAYTRKFSTSRVQSQNYFSSAIIKRDILEVIGDRKLPRLLRWQQVQLARVMSRASQMNRRVVELEKFVQNRLARSAETRPEILADGYPVVMAMTDAEFSRWQYINDAAARAEITAAKLKRELREELEHLRGSDSGDLVAAMAAHQDPEDAQVAEPEPDKGESSD